MRAKQLYKLKGDILCVPNKHIECTPLLINNISKADFNLF